MLTFEREKQITDFLNSLGFLKPNNIEPFDVALTHSSYTYENNLDVLLNYERLEFLGDAVLKLCSSEYLYFLYKDKNEGELSKIRSTLISDAVIFKFALSLNIDKMIQFGIQEEKQGGRKRESNVACAFESLLGALYFEYGIEKVKEFLTPIYKEKVIEIEKNLIKINAKASLQEYTQEKSKDLPSYIVIEESGPAHDMSFIVEVIYQTKCLGRALGKSKKEAEQKAAYMACVKLGIIKEDS